ncbi:MAG: NADH-quinone oxidoreductase subunit NuoK [Deltaproteobacteria bacterium]|nr:NADH-quinone oxidoreductase subunit NuoK [Deltaproteobacteria bacterium]
MNAPYGHVLLLAVSLFLLGAVSAALRRNLFLVLVGVEVMLNAAGLAFVVAALRWRQPDGQAFVLFLLAVAAAEVAVGLALLVYGHRRTGSVDSDRYTALRG